MSAETPTRPARTRPEPGELELREMTLHGHRVAYQFPERCERLILVDSGGLGREVHLLLRAATLPGADFVLPLLAAMLIWGERDPIIPVEHGHDAHALVPTSRLEVFPDAGHFPHLDEPQRFLDVVLDFLDSTEPADVDADEWGELVRKG